MEQFSKEPKCGTNQSFFSSHTKKSQNFNNSLTSREITVAQPDQTVQIDSKSSTSRQQQEQIYLSSPNLLDYYHHHVANNNKNELSHLIITISISHDYISSYRCYDYSCVFNHNRTNIQ